MKIMMKIHKNVLKILQVWQKVNFSTLIILVILAPPLTEVIFGLLLM